MGIRTDLPLTAAPQRDVGKLLELAHVNVVGALEAIEAGDINYAVAQLWNADDQLLGLRALADAA